MGKPLQPRNQVYQVVRAKDGTQWGLLPNGTFNYDVLMHDLDGNPMEVIAEFTETSWKRAKEAYEAVMAD